MTGRQIAVVANQAVAVLTIEVVVVVVVVEVVRPAVEAAVAPQVLQVGNRVAVVPVTTNRPIGSPKIGVRIKLVGIRVHGAVLKIKISGNMAVVKGVIAKIMAIQITIMDSIKIGVDHRLVNIYFIICFFEKFASNHQKILILKRFSK